MKRDKDWLDELGGMLREAETPPPAGGWERLERELPAVPKGFWFIRNWPRVAAVAAAVLICVAAGDAFRRAHSVQGDDVRVVVASAAADSARLVPEYNKIAVTDNADGELTARVEQEYRRQLGDRVAAAPVTAQRVRKTESVQSKLLTVQHSQTDRAVENRDSENRSVELTAAETRSIEGENSGAPAADGQRSFAAGKSAQSSRASAGKDWLAEERTAKEGSLRSKVALGLFAGGGVISSGSHGEGTNTFMSNPLIPGTGVNLVKYDYRNCSYDHKLPLSFGVTFGMELPHGLSLESGLIYSLLRSEVAVQYGDAKLQQRLHFIGIPLRLNWRVLDRSGFSLYIGTGAMAEKCVSARFGNESVDEKGFQGSVFGVAGMQYKLGGPAALYFEPEVSYYFTKTQLRTSRTDSPVSLSLQLGVRFSF